jgi:hypothetical protein
MSIVAIGLNLLLAALLLAALAMGFRLNSRLKALKDSHEGFARAVAELDAAAARAEQGLADLRAATDEATDELADRIEKARTLTAKLDRQLSAAEAGPVSAPVSGPPPGALRDAAARGDIDFAADVERVTHKLGSLLSGAREPRPRRAPEPVLRREPAPTRQRPAFEDELFAEPGEVEPRRAEAQPLESQDEPRRRPLRSVMGGRR